jgi:hypothetical protein
MAFQKAEKKKAKLKLALAGATGSGKTFSALLLARKLAGPTGRIALIDSERGSAELYADRFQFDTDNLIDHAIPTYRASIRAAAAAGYDVLIIDSASHEWMGKGGALETVDRLGGNNKFTNGWSQVTPMHTTFLDDLLSYPGHVIVTLRKKMEYDLEKDSHGKVVPKKVGLAPVQREGFEYEMSVVLDMEVGGQLTVSKTRCSALEDIKATLRREDIEKIGDILLKWLNDGADAPPPAAPKPEPTPAPAAAQGPSVDVAGFTKRIQTATKDELQKIALELAKNPAAREALRGTFNQRQAELKAATAAGERAA